MNDNLPKRPIFWQVMFLSAFALGAILWGVWMIKYVRQSRYNASQNFFVPTTTNFVGMSPAISNAVSTNVGAVHSPATNALAPVSPK